MKKLILSLLLIFCLSFRASAWNPMVVLSGDGESHCASTDCSVCDVQERFECGATDGNEENTWVEVVAGTNWNMDYTTTVLSGTESLYAEGGAIYKTAVSGSDIYVAGMLQITGSASQYVMYLDDGADNLLTLRCLWTTDHYNLRLYYDGVAGNIIGTTDFNDDEIVYFKVRYITGSGNDAKYYFYLSTNGTDWTEQSGGSPKEDGIWTNDATFLRLRGYLANPNGTIFDDIRVDGSDINY